MTTIGDISPVPQRRIPCLQGRHGISSVLLTWLFRPGSVGPGFLSRLGLRARGTTPPRRGPLLAAVLVARLMEQMSIKISLKDFMGNPAVRAIGRYLDQ